MLSNLWCLLFALPLNGCAVHFTHADTKVSPELRNIYFPSATNSTTRGGQAARLSDDIRNELSKLGRVRFVGPDKAIVGVDVRIENAKKLVSIIKNCSTQQAATVRPIICLGNPEETEFSSKEKLVFSVRTSLVDLRTGQPLDSWSRVFETVYNVVAEDTSGADYSGINDIVRELHPLRFLDNQDQAIYGKGSEIANDILGHLSLLSRQYLTKD